MERGNGSRMVVTAIPEGDEHERVRVARGLGSVPDRFGHGPTLPDRVAVSHLAGKAAQRSRNVFQRLVGVCETHRNRVDSVPTNIR